MTSPVEIADAVAIIALTVPATIAGARRSENFHLHVSTFAAIQAVVTPITLAFAVEALAAVAAVVWAGHHQVTRGPGPAGATLTRAEHANAVLAAIGRLAGNHLRTVSTHPPGIADANTILTVSILAAAFRAWHCLRAIFAHETRGAKTAITETTTIARARAGGVVSISNNARAWDGNGAVFTIKTDIALALAIVTESVARAAILAFRAPFAGFAPVSGGTEASAIEADSSTGANISVGIARAVIGGAAVLKTFVAGLAVAPSVLAYTVASARFILECRTGDLPPACGADPTGVAIAFRGGFLAEAVTIAAIGALVSGREGTVAPSPSNVAMADSSFALPVIFSGAFVGTTLGVLTCGTFPLIVAGANTKGAISAVTTFLASVHRATRSLFTRRTGPARQAVAHAILTFSTTRTIFRAGFGLGAVAPIPAEYALAARRGCTCFRRLIF